METESGHKGAAAASNLHIVKGNKHICQEGKDWK